ncbi:MAG: hypothetical protein R3F60_11540 [bacterium]
MTAAEARAVAARLEAEGLVLAWSETSAENPLWWAAGEVREIEVRFMKRDRVLRRRVRRTRADDPTPVCWETTHDRGWLPMTLERPHLVAERLAWRARGRLPAVVSDEPPTAGG